MSHFSKPVLYGVLSALCALTLPVWGQDSPGDWQAQVRKYSEAKNWAAAMRIVHEQIARTPEDVDVRAWRARVLAWSGRLTEAEKEYLEVLQYSKNDPDNWLGLAMVYLDQKRPHEALQAADKAVELDPHRADVHRARGRALAALGDKNDAKLEFETAYRLEPEHAEARIGQRAIVGKAKNEFRLGEENNAFNFLYPNYDESASLHTNWSMHWSTTFVGNFFQWGPAHAGKFGASVTGQLPRWGGLTVGGDAGHDSGVIPKRETFFELDHGWKIGESGFLRGLEVTYEQHWYWYSSARVLTLTGVALVYLPRDVTFSLSETEARSNFPGLGGQWRPSGVARLEFPITQQGEKRLRGNVFFGTGTEDFASVAQIGSFASQTYGGGFQFWLNSRQDIGPYASYQKRSQGKTDTNFGLSYGFRF